MVCYHKDIRKSRFERPALGGSLIYALTVWLCTLYRLPNIFLCDRGLGVERILIMSDYLCVGGLGFKLKLDRMASHTGR